MMLRILNLDMIWHFNIIINNQTSQRILGLKMWMHCWKFLCTHIFLSIGACFIILGHCNILNFFWLDSLSYFNYGHELKTRIVVTICNLTNYWFNFTYIRWLFQFWWIHFGVFMTFISYLTSPCPTLIHF